MNTNTKILVAYHKPAILFKNDILTPIHVGRMNAKNRGMSNDNYQWMISNTIGDDDGENISELNPNFCELTAVYWAWMNYDKLGSPNYIGLEHYRRHFNIDASLPVFLGDYDIVAPIESLKNETIESQFSNGHKSVDFSEVIDFLCSLCPEYAKIAKSYTKQNNGYFYNMFIMKKHVFFEYCEWIFKILLQLHKKTDYSEYNEFDQRMPGYLGERLLGIFIQKKKLEGLKVKNTKVIFNNNTSLKNTVKPIFERKSIPIIFTCDNFYAPYLDVAIRSIELNASVEYNYEIYVCHTEISKRNQDLIYSRHKHNILIKFIDISGYLNDVKQDIFYLNGHFSLAVYFRFFIPEIFKKFKKIIYLDCDIVVNDDLSKLFFEDLQGKYLGAAFDIEANRIMRTNNNFKKYVQEKLKLNSLSSYFQAGVLIYDIEKLIGFDVVNKCIHKLKELKNPHFLDQDVLNCVFNGHVHYFNIAWNVEWHIPLYVPDFDRELSVKVYKDYMNSRNSPHIIHFSGKIKPWNYPEAELANYFWQYARDSPFYEEILHLYTFEAIKKFEATKNIYKQYKLKYYLYKVLSKITIGTTRHRYKEKRQKYKKNLKIAQRNLT
ncbi:MAG: DUF4422 domain-containing protein [Chlorobiaceae bacterium]